MINRPSSKNKNAIDMGIPKSKSITVVKNRPGGVAQLDTKLLPTIIIIAKLHMLPINDRKPPIKTLFILLTPEIA